MQRKSPARDVVARTASFQPPVPAATRTGGRRVAVRLASAGLLVGMTVAAGVALVGAWSDSPVEVRFRPPEATAPAAAASLLEIDRAEGVVTLLRADDLVWRAHGPVDCVSGRRWTQRSDGATLVERACVRLRDGAVVALSGRVPPGAAIRFR